MKTLKILGTLIVVNVLWTAIFSFVEIKDTFYLGEPPVQLYFLIFLSVFITLTFFVSSLIHNRYFFIVPMLLSVGCVVISGLIFKDTSGQTFLDNIGIITLIICIATSSLLSIFSFILIFLKDSKSQSNVSVNKNANDKKEVTSNNFSYQSPGAVDDQNTHTISEKERILKLKEELNGIDFKNAPTMEEQDSIDQDNNINEKSDTESYENTQELKDELERNQFELRRDIESLNQLKRKKANIANKESIQKSLNKGPVDPYKQTILPRRNLKNVDAKKYAEPIGNTSSKFKNNAPRRTTRAEVKLDEYKDKIFLGDSERIWQLTRKQDRSLLQRQAELANQQEEKANTKQFNSTFLNEVISDEGNKSTDMSSISEDILTIDWDDD